MRATVLGLGVELQKERNARIPKEDVLGILSEDWNEFQNGMYMEGERKHWKIRSYAIYIEIKQLGHNVKEVNLECHLKWFTTTSTIEGLGEEVELSTTRVLFS